MINQICEVCGNIVHNNWCLRIYDEKESIEINGCESCITKLDNTIKNVKGLAKKSPSKIIKELNL